MPSPEAPRPAPAGPGASGLVLAVEDDASVRAVVTMVLERAGFTVRPAADGAAALDALAATEFDLVVLDLMLPGPDGFEVCRRLRHTSATPVLVLTARTDTRDLVTALELGADDYVTKPFQPAELIARARALVRRAANDVLTTIEIGDLSVDLRAQRAERAGEELSLTPIEFRLLAELVTHPGQALTREDLLRSVWGYDYLGDSRLVDMAVRRLRAKVGDRPTDGHIATIRGVGYRLDP